MDINIEKTNLSDIGAAVSIPKTEYLVKTLGIRPMHMAIPRKDSSSPFGTDLEVFAAALSFLSKISEKNHAPCI